MKTNNNNFFKSIKAGLIVLVLIGTTSMYAQTTPSLFQQSNGDNTQVKDNHDSIPLDGGLAILLLGAAAFGVKKLRDNRKKDM